jgi:hypothetical protein
MYANLAIASLLSKKIAAGVNLVGLDVRVSPFGNLGRTYEVVFNVFEKIRFSCETGGNNGKMFFERLFSTVSNLILVEGELWLLFIKYLTIK